MKERYTCVGLTFLLSSININHYSRKKPPRSRQVTTLAAGLRLGQPTCEEHRVKEQDASDGRSLTRAWRQADGELRFRSEPLRRCVLRAHLLFDQRLVRDAGHALEELLHSHA